MGWSDVNPLRQRCSSRPYPVRLRLFLVDYVILLLIGQCPPSELQSDLHLVLFLSLHRTLTPAFLDEQPFTTTTPPMSTSTLLRLATRAHSPSATLLRSPISCSAVPRRLWAPVAGGGPGSAHTFSTTVRRRSGEHGEESFEEFTARYGLPPTKKRSRPPAYPPGAATSSRIRLWENQLVDERPLPPRKQIRKGIRCRAGCL